MNAILKTEIRGKGGVPPALLGDRQRHHRPPIQLGISNLFHPGRHLAHVMTPSPAALSAYANKKVDLLSTFSSFVPTSLITPFAENLILTVIVIAVLTGAGLRRVRTEQLAVGVAGYRAIEDAVETLQRLTEVVLGWVIKLVPFAVFGVVAKSVGEITATRPSRGSPRTWRWESGA